MAYADSRGTASENLSLMLSLTDCMYFCKTFLRYNSLDSDRVSSARCSLPGSFRDLANSQTGAAF